MQCDPIELTATTINFEHSYANGTGIATFHVKCWQHQLEATSEYWSHRLLGLCLAFEGYGDDDDDDGDISSTTVDFHFA